MIPDELAAAVVALQLRGYSVRVEPPHHHVVHYFAYIDRAGVPRSCGYGRTPAKALSEAVTSLESFERAMQTLRRLAQP